MTDSAGILKNNPNNKYWHNLREFSFNYWWLAIAALLMRRIPFAIFAPDEFVPLKKLVLIASYILLAFVLLRNWRYLSVRLVFVGVMMNFVAILVNGGLMPTSPEIRDMAGMLPMGPEGIGHVLPQGSGILLMQEQTHLWFLTDIVPVRSVYAIVSLGDITIMVGLLFFIIESIAIPRKALTRLPKTTSPAQG